jgi:chromosomal replication initiator protein
MWLRPIEVRSFDGGVLRLRAPNSYIRSWFESNFLGTLLKEIRELGHDEVHVEFEPDGLDASSQSTEDVADDLESPIAPRIDAVARRAPTVAAAIAPVIRDEDVMHAPEAASLNPRYNFETFVAGPSNQLAFAASQAAASSYPPKYNPVFICGGVGLGKTHLLHSIGHQQLANRPGARIVHSRASGS